MSPAPGRRRSPRPSCGKAPAKVIAGLVDDHVERHGGGDGAGGEPAERRPARRRGRAAAARCAARRSRARRRAPPAEGCWRRSAAGGQGEAQRRADAQVGALGARGDVRAAARSGALRRRRATKAAAAAISSEERERRGHASTERHASKVPWRSGGAEPPGPDAARRPRSLADEPGAERVAPDGAEEQVRRDAHEGARDDERGGEPANGEVLHVLHGGEAERGGRGVDDAVDRLVELAPARRAARGWRAASRLPRSAPRPG